MIATVVNAIAIIIGSALGLFLRRFNMEKYSDTIIKGISLCVLVIGIMGATKEPNILLAISSISIGGIIGEILNIEGRLEGLGKYAEEKFFRNSGKFAQGFVTTTLIYCVGAMAILGALESGLSGNHQTLYAKSMMDGVSAIAFASTMGIGVMFSSVSVFIYQGLITLGAGFLKDILVGEVIKQVSCVGSILIIAISFNVLGVTKIKTANLIPAIFVPVVYFSFLGFF